MENTGQGQWLAAIAANARVIAESEGPRLVSIVCGSERDRQFWETRARRFAADLFCDDGNVRILTLVEGVPRGNFLGTMAAWLENRSATDRTQPGLMVMVYGEGRRLSPFTQALGNRKPALPTLAASKHAGMYVNAAELAMRHTALPFDAIRHGDFRGLLIKWGDEAIIPEMLWPPMALSDVDAIRFVSGMEPTDVTASEKEWLVFDPSSGEVLAELPRQSLHTLKPRVDAARASGLEVGVNLGSLAASYDLLDVAAEILGPLIQRNIRLDWDPFVWMALLCRTEADWFRETQQANEVVREGLRELETRVPGFYQLISSIREALERKHSRPFRVVGFNFGSALWIDLGLHTSVRRIFGAVAGNEGEAAVFRTLFGIPTTRDERGNTIVRSHIASSASVRNSVVIDSTIGGKSIVDGAIVVGSQIERLVMRQGGVVLFCSGADIAFRGQHAIALAWRGESLTMQEGDRATLVRGAGNMTEMHSNESLIRYDGSNFNSPILDNPISFAAAAAQAAVYGAAYEESMTVAEPSSSLPR